jgi:hypothetical protein
MTQGLIPAECSRFDIVSAYAAFGAWWHKDGLTERCRAKHKSISEQLHNLRYSPGMGSYFEADSPAADIYLELVRRWHPDRYEEECRLAAEGEMP